MNEENCALKLVDEIIQLQRTVYDNSQIGYA